MEVKVRLGAGLAKAAGTSHLRIELPEEATVAALLGRLEVLHPALTAGLESALPVVRGEQAGADRPLADGDEVALLIPVAGGALARRRMRTPREGGEPWR
jgi:molybdopterin converting factor small subunit